MKKSTSTFSFIAFVFSIIIITGCNKDIKLPTDKIEEDTSTLRAVDLGLSVKWASINVGASSIYDPGEYFAWGETSEKMSYDEDNYKFHRAEKAHYACDTYIISDGEKELTSTTEKEAGTVYSKYWINNLKDDFLGDIVKFEYRWLDFFPDNKTKLEINDNDDNKNDDCAFARLGKGGRMPTKEECMELVSKCKIELKLKENYQSVFEITGPNGNHIDFPTEGGYKRNNAKRASSVYLWTSEIDQNNPENAFYLYISSGDYDCSSYPRIYGLSVRAVRD